MKKDQRDRIVKRHRHSIYMYGNKPEALFWQNQGVQELRFEVLLDCGIKSGDSVLDVGCGFADLYRYLADQDINVEYTGIDLSPDMIEQAKALNESIALFNGDLFDFDPAEKSYDWVLLSGALNEPLQDNGEYVAKIIPRLYATCRRGLAFNLLNESYDWQAKDRYMLQPYRDEDILAIINKLSAYTAFRGDYMAVDASYFVWRKSEYKP